MQGAEGVAVECGHGDMKMRQGFDSSRFQEGCHQRPWRTGARPTGQGPSAHRSEKKKAARRQHGYRAVYKIVQDFLLSNRSEERRVGQECVVRLDFGGRRLIKKNKLN